MQFSILFFFILFCINNVLHLVSEKVIIVIFILFVTVLMSFLGKMVRSEFENKTEEILSDINSYMNSVFNFLYVNKFFYINLKHFIVAVQTLNSSILSKIKQRSLVNFI